MRIEESAKRYLLLFAGSMAILGSHTTCSSHSMPLLSNPILPRCGLFLVLLAVVFSSAAAQQAPAYEVHPDYTARQWTLQDGLPSNTIRQIVPTSDGYLWLRTEAGLARFDGRRFTVFNPTNTPNLQTSITGQLIEGPPGYLWIAEDRTGLVLYHNGRFKSVSPGVRGFAVGLRGAA